ncbi:MAG: glucosamine-6-phosphate deaminase [Chitinivibrionales bacterium]|nr:glucosamine-6-phosphate deaminase [Chitinivibrionales bacterium]MBD3396054.1 glucosamine-6-phosphate deaminase [Chitinivibrionales bacterium]
MNTNVLDTVAECGARAARHAADAVNAAIENQGEASIIVATGASQFDMLAALVALPVDWSRVTAFHLDEYIGLDEFHPASFRRYLKERFVDRVDNLREFVYVNGSAADPQAECDRLGRRIARCRIDVACVGIGENGHLAFNDPPADFDTDTPYLAVELDEQCRRQQMGEGWFDSLDQVPSKAISMSVRQILKSAAIVCTVPDRRKAEAVRNTVQGPVTNTVPASILQTHPDTHLFLDRESAGMLDRESL